MVLMSTTYARERVCFSRKALSITKANLKVVKEMGMASGNPSKLRRSTKDSSKMARRRALEFTIITGIKCYRIAGCLRKTSQVGLDSSSLGRKALPQRRRKGMMIELLLSWWSNVLWAASEESYNLPNSWGPTWVTSSRRRSVRKAFKKSSSRSGTFHQRRESQSLSQTSRKALGFQYHRQG